MVAQKDPLCKKHTKVSGSCASQGYDKPLGADPVYKEAKLFRKGKDAQSEPPSMCCACSRSSDTGSDLVSFTNADGQGCSACCTQSPSLLSKYENGKDEPTSTCNSRGATSVDCSYTAVTVAV